MRNILKVIFFIQVLLLIAKLVGLNINWIVTLLPIISIITIVLAIMIIIIMSSFIYDGDDDDDDDTPSTTYYST